MKKMLTVFMAAAMIMMMSTASFAASTTEDGAVGTALGNAGITKDKIRGLEVEKEGGKIEVEFIRADNGTEYSYDISASDGRILEKSVDYVYSRNKSKKKIGAAKARKKAAAVTGIKYKTVKKGTCKYRYKGKQGKYTVKFRSGGYRYEVEIQAPTGTVMELEMDAVKK